MSTKLKRNLSVFRGPELYMTHSHNNFGQVLQYAINGLVEILNQSQGKPSDYRVILTDTMGNVYFSVMGEATEIVGMRKAGNPIKREEADIGESGGRKARIIIDPEGL